MYVALFKDVEEQEQEQGQEQELEPKSIILVWNSLMGATPIHFIKLGFLQKEK